MPTPFENVMHGLSQADRDIINKQRAAAVARAVEETKNGMKLVHQLRAGPLRLEAVERDGHLTYTACFDNDVMAHMGEQAAKLFCNFVTETEERR